jgi:hypothetical protein
VSDHDRKPSPVKREKVIFDRLKPPARHRKQPAENPHEDRFNAIHGRNERAGLRDKYRKNYKGKHRKDGK